MVGIILPTMTAKELREKYLQFFENKGHVRIPSASLVPSEKTELSGTQRVLFTTAGMHPLIPFLLGEPHPHGKRLVNVQKSLRTDDIEEVGDSWHNTFFEMLGNWSLGNYWKKEAISWSFEFITKELGIKKDDLWVTVFAGDPSTGSGQVPKDEESIEIWRSLGILDERIIPLGRKDNWWGPVGETGPCGPDTEMFVDTTGKPHGSASSPPGSTCLPGDGCGRFAEIWNDVFMEYNKTAEGRYEPLKQRNVDTGMGVERTLAILQGKDNVYDTELFQPAMSHLESSSSTWNVKSGRIIADHMRAALFIVAEGILPSNKDQGYVLRRLIRRAYAKGVYSLHSDLPVGDIFDLYAEVYKEKYPEVFNDRSNKLDVFAHEIDRFNKTLNLGVQEFHKIKSNSNATISGKEAFLLHSSFGLTIDITKDLAGEVGLKVDEKGFEEEFAKHQEISRAGMEKKFAGGLADHSDITVRGHTATHLLHQALRDVLGDHVHQTGSNITPERIRFDFSHGEKLSPEQIKKVEEIVNSKISSDLPVHKELMSQEEADKKGAIGLFREKYGEKVSIYEIGPSRSASSGQAGSGQDKPYSTEYCGGPHVEHTEQVGKFKIVKEEALSAGQRRIRAVLE